MIPGDNNHPRPHVVVARSTKLVARGLVLSRFAEFELAFAHMPGDDLQDVVSTGNGESVYAIRTGNAKSDRFICGDQHAFRNEIELLRNKPNRDRSVRLDGGSQVALDELTVKVQSEGIDLAGVAKSFLCQAEHLVGKTDAEPNQREG